MIGRSARWSGAGINNGHKRLHDSCVQPRSYSQLLRRPRPGQHAVSARRPNPFVPIQSRSISLFGWSPTKSTPNEFVATHTNPTPTPPTTNVNDPSFIHPPSPLETPRTIKASHATSDIPDPSVPIQDSPPYTHEPSIVHDIENAIALPQSGNLDLNAVQSLPETIGYLRQIGLDYGWGFTTLNQWVLEHLHLTAGLTWGASIVTLAVAFRVLVWPLTAKSSDQSARLQAISPELKPLQETMKKAAEKKDQQQILQLRIQIKDLFAQNDIKMYRIFVPILIQIPFQFGAFRLMRGMSSLPVPALESEHFLWMNNLLIGDPYYILPVISSAAIYGAIHFGTPETGPQNNEMMTTEMRRILRVAFPVGNFAFMLFQPGAVQIYFTITSLLASLQSFLMMNPATRRLLGLYPMPKPQLPPPGSAAKVIPASGSASLPADSNVSIVDKGVDWVKAGAQSQMKSLSNLKGMTMGTKEEQIKRQQQDTAELHEARRRREIREQRELQNQTLQDSHVEAPGVLHLPARPAPPADNFGDDGRATFVPLEKKGKGKGKGKRRVVPKVGHSSG